MRAHRALRAGRRARARTANHHVPRLIKRAPQSRSESARRTFLRTGVAFASPPRQKSPPRLELSTDYSSPGLTWSFPQFIHKLCTSWSGLPTERSRLTTTLSQLCPQPDRWRCQKPTGVGTTEPTTVDGTVDNSGWLWINRDGPEVVHHPDVVVPGYIPCSSTTDHATRPAQTTLVPTTHSPYYYYGHFFSLKKKEKEKKARWISGQLGLDRQDGSANSSDPDAEIAAHALRWNSCGGRWRELPASSGRTSRARRS